MALISQMDPKEAGELLYKKFMAAHEANDANGRPEDHPSRDVQKWNRIAATGGMNSEKRIEKGEDDEQPELTAGGNSGSGGPMPAQDSRSHFAMGLDGVPRFYQVKEVNGEVLTTVLTGDAAIIARAGMSSPARVKRMAAAIPGYNNRK